MVKDGFKYGLGAGAGICAVVAIGYTVLALVDAVYNNHKSQKEKNHLPNKDQKD